MPIRRCSELIDRAALGAMDPTDRLIELCRAARATRYLSAPAAKSYLDSARFAKFAIDVAWMSYEGYPDYPQLWGGYEPKVSVIDLLHNTGASAPRYLVREARASRSADR